MARVPNLGVNRLLPETTQPVPVGPSAKTAVFNEFVEGLKPISDYLRPLAAEESAQRGAAQATDALARGEEIEPRHPYTARSRAFNTVGARGLAVRAATDAQVAIDDAVRQHGHDPEALKTSLAALRAGYASELNGFDQAAVEFNALWERKAGVALRASGELAAEAIIDQDRAQATDALAVFERGVNQLALAGGSADEIAAEKAQLQELLIQFGPRGEFELNGETYAADDARSAVLTVTQIQRAIVGTKESAEVLAIQGNFNRSRAKGRFAAAFKADLLAGQAPVDPAKGLALLNQMEAELRSLEAAGRSRRAAHRAEMRAQTRQINAATGAGFPVADERFEQMLAEAGGDPVLSREITEARTRARAIRTTRAMGPIGRQAYIDDARANAQAMADAGGVAVADLQILDQLEREQSALLAAVTPDSTGLALGIEALGEGALTSPEGLAEMRRAAHGKESILDGINELETSIEFVRQFRDLSATEKEVGMERLSSIVAEMTAAGTTIDFGTGWFFRLWILKGMCWVSAPVRSIIRFLSMLTPPKQRFIRRGGICTVCIMPWTH